jgi:hypothetical protein
MSKLCLSKVEYESHGFILMEHKDIFGQITAQSILDGTGKGTYTAELDPEFAKKAMDRASEVLQDHGVKDKATVEYIHEEECPHCHKTHKVVRTKNIVCTMHWCAECGLARTAGKNWLGDLTTSSLLDEDSEE